MPLADSYTLPAAADMHVHLRNAPGPIASLATPTIRKAGIDTVFVMPNLAPRPVVSVAEALAYKEALQRIDGGVEYLMSLYLHEEVTAEVIREGRKVGVKGVKVSFFFFCCVWFCLFVGFVDLAMDGWGGGGLCDEKGKGVDQR